MLRSALEPPHTFTGNDRNEKPGSKAGLIASICK
jgi:hypothetical protein